MRGNAYKVPRKGLSPEAMFPVYLIRSPVPYRGFVGDALWTGKRREASLPRGEKENQLAS